MVYLIVIYIILAISGLIYVLNRDRIFFVYLMVFVVYSIMPLICEFFYPDITFRQMKYLTDERVCVLYYTYILVALGMHLIFFDLILKNKYKKFMQEGKEKISFSPFIIRKKMQKEWNIFYHIIFCCVVLVVAYELATKYSTLQYSMQNVSFLCEYILSFSGIFLMIQYLGFCQSKRRLEKTFLVVEGIVFLIFLLLLCKRMGERGAVLPYIIGVFWVVLEKGNIKVTVSKLVKLIKPIMIILLTLLFSQIIRVTRGGGRVTASNLIGFFKPEIFFFQDYAAPGLQLMYCIENNFIHFFEVLKSNIGNGIFILSYSTVGDMISKKVGSGLGSFILAEGYMAYGWLGCIFIPLIVTVSFRLYYKWFLTKGDKNDKLFIGFLMSSLFSFNVARGQSFVFFKYAYMYFIPAVILYLMLLNGKLYINRRTIEKKLQNKLSN